MRVADDLMPMSFATLKGNTFFSKQSKSSLFQKTLPSNTPTENPIREQTPSACIRYYNGFSFLAGRTRIADQSSSIETMDTGRYLNGFIIAHNESRLTSVEIDDRPFGYASQHTLSDTIAESIGGNHRSNSRRFLMNNTVNSIW
jgi:hypothetical protein